MKFFLFFLLFSSISAMAQECHEEKAVYVLEEENSSIFNLPKTCEDKEVLIAVPNLAPQSTKTFLVNVAKSINHTLISITGKNFLKGNVFAEQGCRYGGSFEIEDNIEVFGNVLNDKEMRVLDIKHTMTYSLFRVNVNRLVIEPVAGQHASYKAIKNADASIMSIQPGNVGVNMKLHSMTKKKEPIKFNLNFGPSINIESERNATETKLKPALNFRVAIPL